MKNIYYLNICKLTEIIYVIVFHQVLQQSLKLLSAVTSRTEILLNAK